MRDYHLNKEGACKVAGGKKRQQVLARMEKITQRNELVLAIAGIIRFSRLIGGILMLIIGLLMILKPEWLMFG